VGKEREWSEKDGRGGRASARQGKQKEGSERGRGRMR